MPSSVTAAFEGASVVVTGGGGFIGSHLVDALVHAGARVRVLDNFETGARENLAEHSGGSRVEIVEGDIRDADVCRRVAAGARFVFHQAALGSIPRSMETPDVTFATNVGGTANVLTAARDAGVARVVYASSSSVFGTSEELPKREGREGEVLSPYALSKRMNEELASVFARCFGLECIGLRYFNVYGPRQSPTGPYAAVVPRFFAAVLAGERPIVYGDGEQSRDFTYVEDAVAANLRAAVAPGSACGRAYNIGAGGRTTVAELARTVLGLAGSDAAPEHREARAGDVRHSMADIALARSELAYEPKVRIEEGLSRSWAHYSREQVGAG